MQVNLKDTIAAISTAPGVGGIGIIRISGKDAFKITDKVFKARNNKKITKANSFTIHYGHIVSNAVEKKTKIIDEVLVTVMKAPKTYTKENIVEINCHGGIVASRKILDLVLSKGARLANAGEFTQRAFINGRIDLVQAEATLNIINAKTDAALKPAIYQLEGRLSNAIDNMRKNLIESIAPLEASIDFPDETTTSSSNKNLILSLKRIADECKRFVETADRGIRLQQGIRIVLAGAANVGKSSIMNALVEYERVIVTNISGTTRDVVQELINIKGFPVSIADTAGIMDSSCAITKESINRSLSFFESADLVLFVLDCSRKIKKADLEVAKKIKDKKVVIILNKSDLKNKININKIEKVFPKADKVKISALKKTGIGLLEKSIIRQFFDGKISFSEGIMISNARHKKSLEESHKFLLNAIKLLKNKGYEECVVYEIRHALNSLGDLLGENISEEILDNIFGRFCIGK